MKPVRTRRGALPQSGPLPLSHVLHTPPAEPRRLDSGRNAAVLGAIAGLVAVVVLVVGAIGLPLAMGALGPKTASRPHGSISTELALPVAIATPDPSSTELAQPPADTPPVEATPGDTPVSGNNGPAWWSSIVVSWQDRVQAGGDGWVEVTTRGATQCELAISYATLMQNIGTFGAPSNKTRRRTFTVSDQMAGTAHPKVTCWRDGPRTGPSHAWTVNVPIDPAGATPTPAASTTPAASPTPAASATQGASPTTGPTRAPTAKPSTAATEPTVTPTNAPTPTLTPSTKK